MRSDGSALNLRRWWRSTGFAWAGILYSYNSQANFRIEVWAGVLALIAAAFLRAPLAPIALACALVLSLELVNTAVEAVVDLASPELHPLAKVAKDAAAGAVLVASAGALVVAAVVLLPPLWKVAGGG
ncbi:diacylglycerol kinase [Deinococcus arenicola]|uniref:Diacylglycerol kinase family protein n=1 Tax=Deinococcus arenicola TaxID=2994950 RepID=A0ABU4DKS1_9DEIO|nr:diacylglycerol kinase family protein [Deinococcus sp. ZS9-10]MDV6373015.1 diacylglycerol kinase family protein [Deinococcus sp. ZS9-10]